MALFQLGTLARHYLEVRVKMVERQLSVRDSY